jgi:hypothetical protein
MQIQFDRLSPAFDFSDSSRFASIFILKFEGRFDVLPFLPSVNQLVVGNLSDDLFNFLLVSQASQLLPRQPSPFEFVVALRLQLLLSFFLLTLIGAHLLFNRLWPASSLQRLFSRTTSNSFQ